MNALALSYLMVQAVAICGWPIQEPILIYQNEKENRKLMCVSEDDGSGLSWNVDRDIFDSTSSKFPTTVS